MPASASARDQTAYTVRIIGVDPTGPQATGNQQVADGHPENYPATQPASPDVLPIDLASAWRLAARQNPTIGLAQQVVQERIALLLHARVISVPSLNAGSNYHNHSGNVVQPDGTTLIVPGQKSVYVGGGAGTLAAGTLDVPAVGIFAHLGDVYFAPLAARQDLSASRFDARATSNSILLDVTTQYLELVRAETRFAALRRSELDLAEVVRPTLAFERVGQGRPSDANRLRTEALLLRARVQAAEGDIAIARARSGAATANRSGGHAGKPLRSAGDDHRGRTERSARITRGHGRAISARAERRAAMTSRRRRFAIDKS